MAEEFDELDGGFEGFEDFLSGMKPGTKVTGGTILRYREGGDAADWSDPGAVKRVPANWMMQIGVIDDTFGAKNYGMIEVTFPQAFVDNPVMFVSCVNTLPLGSNYWPRLAACVSSPAAVELYWQTNINVTYIALSWLAIGPVGVP